MKYRISLGEIEVSVPEDIDALVLVADYPPCSYQRDHWVAEYERCRANCQLSADRFERLIYALLSLGIEPTVTLAAYRQLCDAHERE